MKTRPYSMTHIGGKWAAIVKWNGKRYEIVECYRTYKAEERAARARCVAYNNANDNQRKEWGI